MIGRVDFFDSLRFSHRRRPTQTSEPLGFVDMSETNGISLWLTPSGHESWQLNEIIETLAKENEGCLSFEAHVTLMSDDQLPKWSVHEIASKVSDSISKYREYFFSSRNIIKEDLILTLEAVQSGDQFYQCVLAPIEPNQSLTRLNNCLRELFVRNEEERSNLKPYFPHLSLVYGDLTQEQKDGLVTKAQELLDRQKIKGFETIWVSIIQTTGPSNKWKRLCAINLHNGEISWPR
ncbi:hypothetical protein O181_018354 [Austropuccinia psidii MF-1]|uniref:2',3'-cyclic-nucleotide 3'-phosphodiesterase n=1 Tax=Austropuccinia psidii MF-1 TaxID=1389203 RepID=A0A9Q3C7J4_9BASI|nr:hypothetical protein [Austropuccinia psidii MF-1]